MISNFMPTYLKINMFFSSFRFKVGFGVGSGSGCFPQAEQDPDPRKKMLDPHPCSINKLFEKSIIKQRI